METTKTKKKVNIDGKQQKVDHNVYLVLQNLTEALKQHEIALMTWVHKGWPVICCSKTLT